MRYLRLLLSLFIIAPVALFAQTISVESFKLLPNDMTANTYGTMERDQNGDVAALIKMVTSETGFVFDGGMMGIVKTEQKTGEIWIYVPHGLQKITISHQQLGVLRDYYFPVSIEKARTYEMRVISGRVRTVVEEEFTAQYVTFSIEPKNALVYIDGTAYMPQNDGTVSQLLSYGKHEYRVELPGYRTEVGVVEVGREKVVKEIVMQSSKATITLQCAMPEADIYINDEKVGQGSWSGQLAAAMYKVESKREGHQTRLVTLTVKEYEERTVTVPEPIPIYGKLQIQSDPYNAAVFLDGQEIGRTPLLQNDVLIGEHTILIRKEDYHDYNGTVTVEDGKIARFEATLDNSFTAQITSTPKAARVTVDGEYKGLTPLTLTIQPGDYDVEVSKRSFDPQKDKVHLSASSPVYNAKLSKRYFGEWDVYAGACSSYSNLSKGFMSDWNYQVGIYLKKFNIEANMVSYGDLGKGVGSINGYWTMTPQDIDGDGVLDGTHSYRYVYLFGDYRFIGLIGYGIMPSGRFRITPQCGVMYHTLTGTTYYDNGYEDTGTYVLGGQFDLKLEYSPVRHVSVFAVPGYYLPLKLGQIAQKLNENDNVVKNMAGGVFFQLGVGFYF